MGGTRDVHYHRLCMGDIWPLIQHVMRAENRITPEPQSTVLPETPYNQRTMQIPRL